MAAHRVDQPTPAVEIERSAPWFAVDGDRTLRLDYDLSPKSIVFDVGAYEGEWAASIAAMYGCRLHLFEAVPGFAERLRKKFKGNPAIEVHAFGLSGASRLERINVNGNRSSTLVSADALARVEEVKLMGFVEFCQRNGFSSIDLMKINIEGGEYELMDEIIKQDLLVHIKNIQVQFHDFVPHAAERVRQIRNALNRTHRLTYCYDFVWENWRLQDEP